MMTCRDLFGRDEGGQGNPGFVDDLKKLIKQIRFPLGAGDNEQKPLTKKCQYSDVEQQLENIQK